ncbi:MAG: tyrosine-type recombinase/integrase [Planctomycetaceae bacterium]|nr:tyrosine-type recombinase/integrase [Planctomycetaceae bacterium]
MASITKQPNGGFTIQFVGLDRKRRSIRLGAIDLKAVELINVHVEQIVDAKKAGVPFHASLTRWLAGLPDSLHDKLSQVGLIDRRERVKVVTLRSFLDAFIERRKDVKPATREIWRQTANNLTNHFGNDKDIAAIDEAAALDFKQYLVDQSLASTTVAKRLQTVRSFFHDARRRKVIPANPFAEVSAKSRINLDQRRFVTREETARLLDACPNHHWRTIVGLSRYGGLRCPSEVLSLCWQDIDWDKGRMTVQSPKTECHGKASRVIPIFPELRPILEEAFELAAEGAVTVVDDRYRRSSKGPSGWRNCNLRTSFHKIITRAGLNPWPKLFHALRSSRETELAADYPIHVVTAWLGNTPTIALRHYLLTTDADFERASRGDGKAVQKAVQHDDAPRGTDSPDESPFAENSAECEAVRMGADQESWGTRIRT